MTTLGLAAVHPDPGGAWCDLTVLDGVLHVADRITTARIADGSWAPLDLVVEALAGPEGPLGYAVAGQHASARVNGRGVELLRPGCTLDVVTSWPTAPNESASWQPQPVQQPQPAQPASPQRLAGPPAFAWNDDRGRIQLEVAVPVERRRVSVAFRTLLLVPHLIVVAVLGIAASVVLLVGWLVALATARLPGWAARFLGAVLGYSTRVTASLALLTDDYPPFRLTVEDYPVRVEIPEPVPMGRLGVLFRGVLVLPASLVMAVVRLGWGLVLIVGWVIVLVTGRLPWRIALGSAAVVRYTARTTGYAWLLTSRYPSGLYGAPATAPAAEAAPVPVQAPALDEPLSAPDPLDNPLDNPIGSPIDNPVGHPIDGLSAPAAPAPPIPLGRGLQLPGGARALLTLALVLGVLGLGAGTGYDVHRALESPAPSPVATGRALHAAYAQLARSIAAEQANQRQCQSTPQPLACAQQDNERFADALDAFRTSIDRIRHPAAVDADFSRLSQASASMAGDLHRLATIDDPSIYLNALSSDHLEARGSAVDQDYNTLIRALQTMS